MKKDGGPAFQKLSIRHVDGRPREEDQMSVTEGMSLRQWYAGMALQGMCVMYATSLPASQWDLKQLSQDCFSIADAMIAEGEK